MKRLFDIANLFGVAENLEDVQAAFTKIARSELENKEKIAA
jgi:hypothetical protein